MDTINSKEIPEQSDSNVVCETYDNERSKDDKQDDEYVETRTCLSDETYESVESDGFLQQGEGRFGGEHNVTDKSLAQSDDDNVSSSFNLQSIPLSDFSKSKVGPDYPEGSEPCDNPNDAGPNNFEDYDEYDEPDTWLSEETYDSVAVDAIPPSGFIVPNAPAIEPSDLELTTHISTG